jgi:hypothetical protein
MLLRRMSLALMVGALAVAPLRAAEPPPPLVIAGPAHTAANITMAELAQLPMIQVNVSFLTERGTSSASFEGPLLWSVLEKGRRDGSGQARSAGIPNGHDLGSRWVSGGAGSR